MSKFPYPTNYDQQPIALTMFRFQELGWRPPSLDNMDNMDGATSGGVFPDTMASSPSIMLMDEDVVIREEGVFENNGMAA